MDLLLRCLEEFLDVVKKSVPLLLASENDPGIGLVFVLLFVPLHQPG